MLISRKVIANLNVAAWKWRSHAANSRVFPLRKRRSSSRFSQSISLTDRSPNGKQPQSEQTKPKNCEVAKKNTCKHKPQGKDLPTFLITSKMENPNQWRLPKPSMRQDSYPKVKCERHRGILLPHADIDEALRIRR